MCVEYQVSCEFCSHTWTRGQCTGLIAAVSRKFTAFFKAFEQVLHVIALGNTPQNILQLNFNGAASNRGESEK